MQDLTDIELRCIGIGLRAARPDATLTEYVERMIAEIARHRESSATCIIEALAGPIDVRDPRAETIRARDIARGLATEYRYGGHTSELYTVAEHSVIVSFCVPQQHALRALLHDASEAYIRDLPSPVKKLPELAGYRLVEERLQNAIYARFGIDPADAHGAAAVREADIRILADETEQIQPRANVYDEQIAQLGIVSYGHALMCFEPADAERVWLARFRELAPRSMWS